MATNTQAQKRSVKDIYQAAEALGIKNLFAEFGQALHSEFFSQLGGSLQTTMGDILGDPRPVQAKAATPRKATAAEPANDTKPARKVTRGKGKRSLARVCPVPGCGEPAAPRFGMVCKGHSTIPSDDKEIFRVKAKQSGGLWDKTKTAE